MVGRFRLARRTFEVAAFVAVRKGGAFFWIDQPLRSRASPRRDQPLLTEPFAGVG